MAIERAKSAEFTKRNLSRAVQELSYAAKKSEQLAVVTAILNNRDVFVVLPTDFGKSFAFPVCH